MNNTYYKNESKNIYIKISHKEKAVLKSMNLRCNLQYLNDYTKF